jgi:hypothetical protein
MPHRGEVWLVDLGMAEKVRPALVFNVPFQDTDRASCIISRPLAPFCRKSRIGFCSVLRRW